MSNINASELGCQSPDEEEEEQLLLDDYYDDEDPGFPDQPSPPLTIFLGVQ